MFSVKLYMTMISKNMVGRNNIIFFDDGDISHSNRNSYGYTVLQYQYTHVGQNQSKQSYTRWNNHREQAMWNNLKDLGKV